MNEDSMKSFKKIVKKMKKMKKKMKKMKKQIKKLINTNSDKFQNLDKKI